MYISLGQLRLLASLISVYEKTADVGREQFGNEAADFLQNDFHVDDGFTSLSTNKEAIDLIQTTQAMCVSTNLCLHKFSSR